MMHDRTFSDQDASITVPPAGESEPRNSGGGPTLQLALVSVHQTFYGIHIKTIREILRVRKLTWVPSTLPYVAGIVNVRGEMLPIIDLRLLLQTGASDVTDNSRIVVIESKHLAAGLLVDGMVDIVDVPLSGIHAPELNNSGFADPGHPARDCLAGQCRWRAMTITLLESDRLLQGIVVNQA